MVLLHFKRFLYLMVLLLSNIHYIKSTDHDNSLYLIRSTASNLVVDASLSKVTLQYFDGYTPQLWQFKRASRPGLFTIINNSTGKALDVDKDLVNLILSKENNESLNQQWYLNSNRRIFNAGVEKNLNIPHAKYVPANPIIVYVDNGHAAQDFTIKEKRTCGP